MSAHSGLVKSLSFKKVPMIKNNLVVSFFCLALVSFSILQGAGNVLAQETSKTSEVKQETLTKVSEDPTKSLLKFPLGGMEIATPNETHSFVVELALDSARQAQGMMFREELSDDHGMLFMFPNEQMRSFWMRNTLIPLDIIFINASGVIVHIHPNAIPLDETAVPSLTPAKAVLELRGGLAEELAINVGDKVQNLRQFGPVQDGGTETSPN